MLSFIITQVLSGIPLQLLRAVDLVMYSLYRKLSRESTMTRRSLLEGFLAPCAVDYGTALPPIMYILCITLLYWVLAPLVTLFAALYFSFAYLAWKYQFMYVYVRAYESGGKFWYGVFDYSMRGLLASTFTAIGFMAVREGVVQVLLLLPLPLYVYTEWKRLHRTYYLVSLNLPYSAAVEVDASAESRNQPTSSSHPDIENANDDDENVGVSARKLSVSSFSNSLYKSPSLTCPTSVKPYPHRINGIPLLDERGALHEVYFRDDPPAHVPSPSGEDAAVRPAAASASDRVAQLESTASMHVPLLERML